MSTPRYFAVSCAVVLAVAMGCSGKPSLEDVEVAVRRMLPEKIPTPLLVAGGVTGDAFARCQMLDLHEAQANEVRVLEIRAGYRDRTLGRWHTLYPARVWVDGLCLEGSQRHAFRGEWQLTMLHGADGDWIALEN